MKPTEHKTPLEKELIAHIRESLVEHEESYQLGAWEKFNVPQKKQRPLWLPFLQGAAAILVLGLITFLIINKGVFMSNSNPANVRYSIADCKASLDKNNHHPRYNHSIRECDQSIRAEKK